MIIVKYSKLGHFLEKTIVYNRVNLTAEKTAHSQSYVKKIIDNQFSTYYFLLSFTFSK